MPPPELVRAQVIDGIAQRYGIAPSVVAGEDASILHMLAVLQMGTPDTAGGAPRPL